MKFYNTLSRKKELFEPIGKVVTMYACGPTVYNYAHIGNMRTYVFLDLLRRGLKLNGFKLKGVLNITDVGHLLSDGDEGEDKMVKASRERKMTPWEIAKYFTGVFFSDCEKLNIGKSEIIALATDHIQEMIDYVVTLEKKGYAYETDDGIYFDVSKFENYGKLSRIKLDEQQAGKRVKINTQKRNPYDFALWKKADANHIMQWESPWGMGYPGWHIECSAMAKKYLGVTFDIHSGGVDHIPIHHENEIAQSEALEGKKTVNYWLHGEFMLVDSGKMSKSLGNTYTISDLEQKGYSPLDFRYFCLNAHYRKPLNFTFDGLDGAKISLARLYSAIEKHKFSSGHTDPLIIEEYRKKLINAISDDLNIPLALGHLWTLLKNEPSVDIYALALEYDKVLGLSLDKVEKSVEEKTNIDIPENVVVLAQKRLDAKKSKDFASADSLRNEITTLGYVVVDTKEGFEIKKI
ncbi:MAG: cysteine--tRNA ligase [Firmicutes bacterium]|nr:cysteine--tRNA ligase [Bacillota bacterium]MCL2255762.1 cysteine--tRNA ligase [Bacillota bacterium]